MFHKGVDEGPDGLKLISDVIREKLGITMTVLMGANLANEVADEKFCETTIGKNTKMEILCFGNDREGKCAYMCHCNYIQPLYFFKKLIIILCSGCKSKAHGPLLKELMQTQNFRVTVVEEADVVEICGALKVNIHFHSISEAFSWINVKN